MTLTYWTSKCIGIFLSPTCIYVWNMKTISWKLLKLSCQNQQLDKVHFWPFNNKMYKYLPLSTLHRCMIYESCMLKTTRVIVSEPMFWPCSVVILTFDLWPKNFYHHPASMREIWNCTFKPTQVIVSEPKYWQISIVTLTFDLLIPKCIGIFPSPSCIYVWNMKAVYVLKKLLKLSCQNQSVDGQTDGQRWFLRGARLMVGPNYLLEDPLVVLSTSSESGSWREDIFNFF